ncbi:MAG TPA: hypothetical protein VGO53_13245 [Steroidobacteraceae bacterium]|jgi:hypothetical protein|nr:hypothetical protein [Steroidobacteraceae bacterium]
MIDHDGAYAGSHFALAMVAREREDMDLARTEAATARKYWKDADPVWKKPGTLPERVLRGSMGMPV